MVSLAMAALGSTPIPSDLWTRCISELRHCWTVWYRLRGLCAYRSWNKRDLVKQVSETLQPHQSHPAPPHLMLKPLFFHVALCADPLRSVTFPVLFKFHGLLFVERLPEGRWAGGRGSFGVSNTPPVSPLTRYETGMLCDEASNPGGNFTFKVKHYLCNSLFNRIQELLVDLNTIFTS